MMSTPVGHQRSPCLSNNRIVLFARVLKYSPSSTCVPSDSNTTDTFSLCGTPSFSLPKIGWENTERRLVAIINDDRTYMFIGSMINVRGVDLKLRGEETWKEEG